jgi:hypothetical protein
MNMGLTAKAAVKDRYGIFLKKKSINGLKFIKKIAKDATN